MEGRAVEPSQRRYTRLPDDVELLEIFYRHDRSRKATAEEIGCSEAAVGFRLERIYATTGVDHKPVRRPRGSAKADRDRIRRELERKEAAAASLRLARVQAAAAGVDDALEERLAILEARIDKLEQGGGRGGIRVIEWKPNNRRVADGGINTNRQRKAFIRSVERAG